MFGGSGVGVGGWQTTEKDKRKPDTAKLTRLWGVETQIRLLREKQGPKVGPKKFSL